MMVGHSCYLIVIHGFHHAQSCAIPWLPSTNTRQILWTNASYANWLPENVYRVKWKNHHVGTGSISYPAVIKRGNWKSTRNWWFNRKITCFNSVFSSKPCLMTPEGVPIGAILNMKLPGAFHKPLDACETRFLAPFIAPNHLRV